MVTIQIEFDELCLHVGFHKGLADNSIVNADYPLPKEIIAVVRPKSFGKVQGDDAHPSKSGHMCRTDQKSILPEGMEMNLEVKLFDFVPPESRVTKRHMDPAKVVYTCKAKACTKSNVKGLYCFSTEGNQLENIFKKMGTYMFNFSLVSTKFFIWCLLCYTLKVGEAQRN